VDVVAMHIHRSWKGGRGKMAETKKYKTILFEKEPPFGKVIFNQPEKRNPMTSEMVDEASDAFLAFERDEQVRVILLTHNGPVFSSGLPQMELINKSREEILRVTDRFEGFRTLLLRDVGKPIVAYGNSVSLGDIIIISEDSKVALPAINIGLICGRTRVGAFTTGDKVNRRMVLTGDPISAQRALMWGMVDEVVSADKLEETAMDIANRLARKSPVALRLTKRVLWLTRDMTPVTAFSLLHEEIFPSHVASEDGQAAIKAFLEKKTPLWLVDMKDT
jgi:enoyl-CoA hydratase/carnithine racemase